MALTATSYWVVRTDPSTSNGGGGYDPALTGGVDYSNQAEPQETYSSILYSDAGAATAICKRTSGSWAAGIKGNFVYIASGTNATVGRYLVLSRDSDTQITFDRNWCTANVPSNGTGYMGGAIPASVCTDAWWDALVAGMVVYFQAGTHALPNNINVSAAGTAAAPKTIEGFTTTLGDRPRTSRPVLDTNTSGMAVSDFFIIRNVEIENTSGSATYCLTIGEHCLLEDVLVHAKNLGVGLATSSSSGANKFILCEFKSTNDHAFASSNPNHVFYACTFDGGVGSYGASISGAPTGGSNLEFSFCIFKNGGTGGILIASTSFNYLIENCIFYNNTTYGIRIAGSTFADLILYNCLFVSNGTAISFANTQEANFVDYNMFFGNSTNYSGVTAGAHDQIIDPEMVNPASDNFSILKTSPAFKDGMYRLNDLVTAIFSKLGNVNAGAYQDTWNIGAWQMMRADRAPIDQPWLPLGHGFEKWDAVLNYNFKMLFELGARIPCGRYGSEYADTGDLPNAADYGGWIFGTKDGNSIVTPYFSNGTSWVAI